MANSNANFVNYHSKNKTFNFFNIFTIIMKNKKWECAEKVEEKISEAEKCQNLLKIVLF